MVAMEEGSATRRKGRAVEGAGGGGTAVGRAGGEAKKLVNEGDN